MKRTISNLIRKSGIAAIILGTGLALSAPATVMAAEHGGGHFSGGHGGGFSGRSFGGGAVRGGGAYRGGGFSGGYSGGYRGGDHFYRGGYGYRAAPYFGFGYSYAPNSCGYYNAWGQWVPNPGCYVAPYGY